MKNINIQNRKAQLGRIVSAILAIVILAAALPISAVQSAQSVQNPFEDVSPNEYYYDAVIWAYEEGITTGTTETRFAPAATCTRGQVVTFLWRVMGEPEAQSTKNPFKDVKDSDYFYKAVLWAIERGITNGTSDTLFSPDVTCTNAHIITFIWRAMGKPNETGRGEWFADAIAWAKDGGLIDGTYYDEFKPNDQCPRANVVTYLYRYLRSGMLTLYVSRTAGDDYMGNGTWKRPYKTIEAAKNAVRSLDKTKYTSIKIKISGGEYRLNEPLVFTYEDSGTGSCRIYYIGEKDTVITGGVTLSSASFMPTSGETAGYFPDFVRGELFMLDLKPYGVKPEDVREMVMLTNGGGRAPLYLNGSEMTVARYPNDSPATVRHGSAVNSEGGAASATVGKTTSTIVFGSEHMEHVGMWHDLSTVYTQARYSTLSFADNSSVTGVRASTRSMTVPYMGGSDPKEGMPFYWYNIPEELDSPGEYYIDENCVLYFYPTADFEESRMTIPILNDSLVIMDDACYITFSNLTFESSRQSGIVGRTDHFTMKNCTLRSFADKAIELDGTSMMISGNHISSTGNGAVKISGGNPETLRMSDNVIYNNVIRDWSSGLGLGGYAVSVSGCGATVSHNYCADSPDAAITYSGPYHLIEYNRCENAATALGGCGVIGSSDMWTYGTVVRYNHINGCGYTRSDAVDPVGVHGIYADDGQSGVSIYGNIIEDVTGSGIAVGGGRDLSIYGNLMIRCRYALSYDSRFYTSIVRKREGNRFSPPSYTKNGYWMRAFPILPKLLFEDGTNYDDVVRDVLFNAVPVSAVMNNVYYLDEMIADKTQDPFNIESFVYEFSSIETPSAEEGNLYVYSSARAACDVRTCIRDNSERLALTLDQFDMIGVTE